jgi:hypothetical protein
MLYQARVFRCTPPPPYPRPGDRLPPPIELAERSVEARNPDKAVQIIRSELRRDFGVDAVRCINLAPSRRGGKAPPELVAYLHPERTE